MNSLLVLGVAVVLIRMTVTVALIRMTVEADLIQMARPFLADAHWVNKAEKGQADRINTCIPCTTDNRC